MTLSVILYIVGFIRTIFIIAVIYFGIKFISRYILPLLLEKGAKNMQQKMQDQHGRQQRPSRPEGDVTIEKNKNSGSVRNEGEYVDFEEVD